MKVAITGVLGNMGLAVLEELSKLNEIEKIKMLVRSMDKRTKKLKKQYKKIANKLEFIVGSISNDEACEKLVCNVDYVVNLAAVIPPLSDQCPKRAIECNEIGVDKLVYAIEKQAKQPKFIHTSTVALYGNRNEKHLWVRVGDPLLVSPFDIYSVTKLRGEFRVLESNIQNFAILRQTAMLHNNMLQDNISDGLMFHTCFNAPLEWVTAHDSGVLIANILKQDNEKFLGKKFWGKCFNIGNAKNRITGFETLSDGFKMIGGTAKDYYSPCTNATRNFHGVWFYDSDVLEKMFHFQSQSTEDFWNDFLKKHSYFKLGKIVPKKLIKKIFVDKLFKSPNAPAYWAKHNDKAKLFAYFGGENEFKKLTKDWNCFNLLCENKNENGQFVDYQALKQKEQAKMIDYGCDLDDKITLKDLQNVAKKHGGKLLSKEFNELSDKLEWENSDGVRFVARAYSVLAGHWWNPTYLENCWDFDRLAKTDKIYSQIWYDSHSENEDKYYYMDENFETKMRDMK